MKLEELKKLKETLNKKYFCAKIDSNSDNLNGHLNISETSLELDQDPSQEAFTVPLQGADVFALQDTEQAVKFFEELTEKLVRVYGQNAADVQNFQIYMRPSYFFDSSLIETQHRGEIPFDKSRILDGKVCLSLAVEQINGETTYSPIEESFIKGFDEDFYRTPSFVVDYDSFVLRLMTLGYDVNFMTFGELLGSVQEEETPSYVRLSTVELKPKKEFIM